MVLMLRWWEVAYGLRSSSSRARPANIKAAAANLKAAVVSVPSACHKWKLLGHDESKSLAQIVCKELDIA